MCNTASLKTQKQHLEEFHVCSDVEPAWKGGKNGIGALHGNSLHVLCALAWALNCYVKVWIWRRNSRKLSFNHPCVFLLQKGDIAGPWLWWHCIFPWKETKYTLLSLWSMCFSVHECQLAKQKSIKSLNVLIPCPWSRTAALILCFPCVVFCLFCFNFFVPFALSLDTLALGVLLAFAFIPVAQEKNLKQGQLGRERNADNILRDLKEIFTPSWELASPTEGNAAQCEQAVCLFSKLV